MIDGAPDFPEDVFPDDARSVRLAIVAARWNAEVTDALLAGAEAACRRLGAPKPVVSRVPGAYELPVVAAGWARSGKVDAVVCLGVVIRGETPHFDFVAGPVAHSLQTVAVETGIPVSFGVLTCETMQQAQERAGGRVGNKGEEAVLAAVETVAVLRRLQVQSTDDHD